ncbi:Protein kinase-like domain [Phytophthora cactorum]|nr:Protein kinase-like domain [Phytophthora cactorum]
MQVHAQVVLLAAIYSCAQAQTITFRSLGAETSPSSAFSSNSSFVFDGSNSDIARQLYIRHKAGDSGEQLELNSVPVAVSKRLHPFNIAFNDLPGLVQRAVLWDTGFAISPGNDAVQIRTMKNYSMADIAIPKSDVASVDCSLLNCSQPNDVEAYYTKYCTGYQILNASRCVVDLFEDSGAGSFLGMMWSVGGDPDMTPELRLRDHTWTQDIEEFGGNVTFSVYAVHTVSSENDPAWDVCPSGYASLPVPCHRRDQFSDEYMAANTTVPTGSAWVTTWLEEEFAQSSGFDDILMIPILLSVVIVVGFGWFCWKCIAKRKKEERSTSVTAEYDFNSTSHYWGGGTPDMVLRPMMVTSQLSSQLSNLSMQYESAGSNTTLQILLAISKGASGEVWLCDFNGEKVAVKRLLQTKHQKAQHVQAFAEEIELSASLIHPHIVEFIGVAWNTLNNLVMAMEYLPMGSLQRYLRVNSELMSWPKDKLRMAIGIAQALEYLHDRKPSLIHRDLKSSNILLTNNWNKADRLWVLEGKRYTERADIYSFGVVLSELDTGKAPYADAVTEHGGMPKPFYVLQDVMAGRLRPSFSQDCPLLIKRIGLASLALDPVRRPTARELVEELLMGL